MKSCRLCLALMFALGMAMVLSLPACASAQAAPTQATALKSGLLSRDEAAAILPPAVFFAGQSATIQARNSAGVRLQGGKVVLATLVDTSGYSSGVQDRYQLYLITEIPLRIGGRTLVPGAYGCGFVGNQFLVMDIAGDTLITAPEASDAAMRRPTPLQMVATPKASAFRLYAGRNYVELNVGP